MKDNEAFTAEEAGNFQASGDEGGGEKDGFLFFFRPSLILEEQCGKVTHMFFGKEG